MYWLMWTLDLEKQMKNKIVLIEYDKLLLVLMLSRSLSSSTTTPLKEEDTILGYCRGIVHAKHVHVILTLK